MRDNKTEQALGFSDLLLKIEELCATQMAKGLLRTESMATGIEGAEKLLDETSAMVDLIAVRDDFCVDPFDDPARILVKAEKGERLEGSAIRSILPLLTSAGRISILYKAMCVDENSPIFFPVPQMIGLAEIIDEAIDSDGQVKPSATPKIETLTKTCDRLKRSIRERAEKLLQKSDIAPMLMDSYVTLRENRFVLPVRAEHKNHLEGILHDSSASGQTFFIEPKELVTMNNRLKEAQIELAEEINRLLAEISEMIAQESSDISLAGDQLVKLDVIFARAKFSILVGGTRPQFGERIALKQFANPLMLVESPDLVRNDISFSGAVKGVIISGPNAGGKTVALKSVGLCAIMAKRGLYIPADEGSMVPFYDSVVAEIGDAQSLDEHLSTFSGHLKKINSIVATAGEGTLVLLDEFMSSTDPKEAGALAIAYLEKLSKTGADTIVTTHFQDIKNMAESGGLFANCAMGFNSDDLRPTYRLVAGIPGSSSGIAMAESLGTDPEIISSAKSYLEGSASRLELALKSLGEKESELSLALDKIEKEKNEAAELLHSAQMMEKESREIRDKISKEVKRKISSDVAQARCAIGELMEQSRKEKSEITKLAENREKLDDMADSILRANAPVARIPAEKLEPGDTVYVVPLGREGKIETINHQAKKVEVSLGGIRTTLNLADITGLAKGSRSSETRVGGKDVYYKNIDKNENDFEINLVGQRVEPAIDMLQKFIDDMIVQKGESARIIHGRGTGRLRMAVREFVACLPYVAIVESGDDAVTTIKVN